MRSFGEIAGKPEGREIAAMLRQLHRVWLLNAAPPIPHLEIGLQEALEPIQAALEQVPHTAAHLRSLPLGEAFIGIMAALGQSLRIPVRIRASQEEWAQLATVLRPHRGSYTPRHAQRVWSQLQQNGRGVRAQRFSISKEASKRRGAKKYQWAWRRRKNGSPFPSSKKVYRRALIRSVAYASREALADHLPAVLDLARAFRIPRAWRTGRWARFRAMPLLRRTNFKFQLQIAAKSDLPAVFSSLLRRSVFGRPKNVISKTDRYAEKKQKGPCGTPSRCPLARSPAPAGAVAPSDTANSAVTAQSPPKNTASPGQPGGGFASILPKTLSEVLPGWIRPWERKEPNA